MIHFETEIAPTFERNNEGNRTVKTRGAFVTNSRLDKTIWAKIKAGGMCRYWSDEDIEDMGNYGDAPGWRYDIRALCLLMRESGPIIVDSIECASNKALFDVIEDAPRRKEVAHQAKEQRQSVAEMIKQIADKIRTSGTRPPASSMPDGDVLFDTRNIGGSGSCFVLAGGPIVWLIEANGMDGDDWAQNNLPGSIGSFVADYKIANLLRQLEVER